MGSLVIIAVTFITISRIGQWVVSGIIEFSPIYVEPLNKEVNCQIFGSDKDNADYDVFLSQKLKNAPFIEKQIIRKNLHIVQFNGLTLYAACGRA
ncbi:MAG TPA: hypothetical protein VFM46_08510, partial [Pseudomonadales bacterium]|nr:hypothetical protein [Pseudomonadales bacterium]